MKHDWELLGGSGSWEVWQCRRCRRSAVPSLFGFFLWPDVLLVLFPWRFGCRV